MVLIIFFLLFFCSLSFFSRDRRYSICLISQKKELSEKQLHEQDRGNKQVQVRGHEQEAPPSLDLCPHPAHLPRCLETGDEERLWNLHLAVSGGGFIPPVTSRGLPKETLREANESWLPPRIGRGGVSVDRALGRARGPHSHSPQTLASFTSVK